MHHQMTAAETDQTQRSGDAHEKCLIIEDSEFDSIKLTRVVSGCTNGLRIKVATTLGQAREDLAEGDTALILLDNNLPDGLGANFAQELARDEILSKIPVIIVSDWPSPFMWEKASAAGVHYVLNKTEFDGRYVRSALEKRQQSPARMN